MKLIVGLGNPGDIYSGSRHNIGFSVIEAIAGEHRVVLRKDKGTFSLVGRGRIGSEVVILAMPLTFMNLSGIAVRALIKKNRVRPADGLLVVCDDLSLEFGRQKIRPRGSSGGHRGIKSIIEELSSQDFSRLRIGIGRPPAHKEASEYVLSLFNRKEREMVKDVVAQAKRCCQSWVIKGITETMNIFNVRSK